MVRALIHGTEGSGFESLVIMLTVFFCFFSSPKKTTKFFGGLVVPYVTSMKFPVLVPLL